MSLPTTINDRTIRKPIEQVDKTVIDQLLIDLEKVPEGKYWGLNEGDPLYIAPVDTLIVPASAVRDPDRTRLVGEEFLLGDVYDRTGRRIPMSERPEGWLEQQEEIRKPGPNMYEENVTYRLGDDYIVVGRGRMFLRGETIIDGERAFEVINRDRYLELERERRVQERRDFLDANPVIEASQPWWSNGIAVEQGERLGETLVGYSLAIGVDDLYLRQDATLKGGKLTLDEVEFQNGYHDVPVAEWPTIAGNLRELADALDRLAEEGR